MQLIDMMNINDIKDFGQKALYKEKEVSIYCL